jgi:vancomycin resistance protein YoaR
LVVLGGVAYGVAYAAVGGGVLPNTTVGSVAIGGLSAKAAQAKLATGLAAEATAPIPVTVAGQSLSVDPVAAGLSIDTHAIVAAGGHRSASPSGLWSDLTGHRRLSVRVAVDHTKLDATVVALNAKIADGGHDGGITFNGSTPVAVAPKPGIGLNETSAANAIQQAYLSPSHQPVDLAVGAVEPSVTAAEVQRVLTTVAQPAVAAPINIVVGTTTLQVAPAVIAQNLTFVAKGGTLVPVLDGQGIVAALGDDAFSSLESPSRNASFDVTSGVPVIVPGVEGGTADVSQLGPALSAVLTQAPPRTVTVPAKGIDPAFTTADAEKLGITQMVSTFTTHYPCCASRVTNIHTIANIVTGAIVQPGATFSLNQFVGMRDTKRGFVEAPMIEDGLFEDSVGGGVSQFATTLYNAVFFAGLKDVEHHPHSYYISRYPVGREATVSWPAPNLIFQNNEPTGILITTSYTGTSLTVTFWGTKYYDVTASQSARYDITTTGTVYDPRPDCEASTGEQGFQIDVTQTLSQNGVVVQTNHLHTKYDAEPIIICGPSPSASGPVGSPTPGAPSVSPSKSSVSPSKPTTTPAPSPSASAKH